MISRSTDKFTVTASNGNVGVGSDLSVTGSISGTFSGDANFDQLKANTAVTIQKDGSTWTELSSITGTAGCYILQIRVHNDGDANSIWVCTSDGTTGSCSRLAASAGSTSSVKLQAQWSAASNIEVKYESSWSGGVGSVNAYAVSLFPAA